MSPSPKGPPAKRPLSSPTRSDQNPKVTNAVTQALAWAAGDKPGGVSDSFWETTSNLIRTLAMLLEEVSSAVSTPPPLNLNLPLSSHLTPNLSSLPPPLSSSLPLPSLSGSSASSRLPPSSFAHSLPYSSASYEDYLRERSLVISGVSESLAASSVDRAESDLSSVKSILATLGIETIPTSVFRMGVPSSASPPLPRLLKVVLPSRSHALRSLSLARSLRSHPQFDGIYIRRSMTLEERKLHSSLRDHLRQLRQADSSCPFVLYRGELWHREEIKTKTRTTLPPSMGNGIA